MSVRTKESYKHRKAKDVLCNWLSSDFTIHTEVAFDGFRPDITAYKDNQIHAFYEVEHKNEISGKTIGMMQYFCYVNNLELLLHVVNAEYILCQCDKPDKIESMVCELLIT
jgi:hypothetical protein